MDANQDATKDLPATADLPDLNDVVAEKTNNEALSGALKRLQERAQNLHNSHYTKHGSHSVKHSSW